MKKIYLLLFLCVVLVMQKSVAGPIDDNTARQYAIRFMNSKIENTRGTTNAAQLSKVNTSFDHLFVYNLQGGGFVIISDDDRTMPVLGYSTVGEINVNDMAPGFASQLQKYNEQLKAIAEGAEVSAYIPHRNSNSVAPLIQTQWKQYSADGTMYNSMLPVDSTLPQTGYRPATGCVATAAAQVMNYWQWPTNGRGSNCITRDDNCWHYGTLCANFESTTYDWNNMPAQLDANSTQAQRDAVGLLQYHCGIASNMWYNSDCQASSSGYSFAIHFALNYFFKYNVHSLHESRFNYSDAEWLTLIKNDLDNHLPILYFGQSVEDADEDTHPAGHAFILDGYDEDDMVHVNWGWGGSYDGYFNLFALTVRDHYNFSHSEEAILNLHPDYEEDDLLFSILGSDVVLDTTTVQKGDNLSGHVDIYNPNDAVVDFFVGQAVIENLSQKFVQWIDAQHLIIPAHDTLHYSFDAPVNLPVGSYYTYMHFAHDTIDVNDSSTLESMVFPTLNSPEVDFWVVDTNKSSMSNLVIFVRFADDDEITYPFNSIDSLFNCKIPGYPSVYNYFDVSSYGKIHFNTLFADQIVNNSIVSFVDEHPRGYYQPYSETNPIGYHGENPLVGISMREAQLLASAIDYVSSMGLVNSFATLDGDGDGYIDNISFIVKGDVGDWSSLLWPHMEFFPHDSIDHPVSINGKLPNTFNFEFEGSVTYGININVFRHEMSHSLGLPDNYHYTNFENVNPSGRWDVMSTSNVMNQTNMMYKNKFLHVADDPIQITEDGTYTLYSNATSASQSCYFIKSAIDADQWYTFEYRNKEDLFDEGIPGTGLIIGRWNNAVPATISANAFFDNDSILHLYWIFRPGSSCDIENGNLNNAHFSAFAGRTAFGPTTDPHPYLADGTPENSFEITEIQEFGEYLTFHVHFLNDGVEEHSLMNGITVYPNPTDKYITVTGNNMRRIEVFNAVGQLQKTIATLDSNRCTISVEDLAPGLHFVRVINNDGTTSEVKFVKTM